MDQLEDEIRNLRQKTDQTRREFLNAEMQTCLTALQMAEHELEVGNLEFAQKEVDSVLEGIRTARRFLPEASAEQRVQIEENVAQLQERLRPVQVSLESATGNRG